MDTYLKLVKKAIQIYTGKGKIITPPKKLPKKMREKAGVFVSLHKKDGSLRGCIGTFLPTTENIAQEIIKNAIAAATADPRFPPVTKEEFSSLTYAVDILSRPKNVSKIDDLDVKRHGLIVSTSDGRRGLLLPDIPGIKTPQRQFEICCLKAGIDPSEKVFLQTFTVKRYAEK